MATNPATTETTTSQRGRERKGADGAKEGGRGIAEIHQNDNQGLCHTSAPLI